MKILLIHTHYQLKGGEEAVFQQESTLLSKGSDVDTVAFYNKGSWQGLLQFLFSIWNLVSVIKLKKRIHDFKPDIIHIHNWHYAAGPIIIRIANMMGVPVVLTLHNYRLLCPSGSLMRRSEVFTDSIHAVFPWKAVKLRLFRNSFLQTFWLAFVVWFHKKIGTWKMVSRFIVLTDFSKSLYASSSLGISPAKFVVKPNFVEHPLIQPCDRQRHFLYVGRLSDEKGVNVLLSAFQDLPYTLSIAGDGPLLEQVKQTAQVCSNINYLGVLDRAGVEYELQACTALLFPSIWFEGMPMTILEAFSLSTPVIASDLGAMASMVQHGVNGLHFEAGNVVMLQDTLMKWHSLPELEKAAYGYRARETYERFYTPEANHQLLMGIYEEVIAEHSSSLPSTDPELASNAVGMNVTISN